MSEWDGWTEEQLDEDCTVCNRPRRVCIEEYEPRPDTGL